jgi:hypothetical protein
VREECYARALASLIDAQHRQPLAAHWGQRDHFLLLAVHVQVPAALKTKMIISADFG